MAGIEAEDMAAFGKSRSRFYRARPVDRRNRSAFPENGIVALDPAGEHHVVQQDVMGDPAAEQIVELAQLRDNLQRIEAGDDFLDGG